MPFSVLVIMYVRGLSGQNAGNRKLRNLKKSKELVSLEGVMEIDSLKGGGWKLTDGLKGES